jgi:hypothetical protein
MAIKTSASLSNTCMCFHYIYLTQQLYYIAIVTNFAARWLWTLTVSPESLGIYSELNPLIFATILAAIEIIRRAQWNIFRVENEQINRHPELYCTLL